MAIRELIYETDKEWCMCQEKYHYWLVLCEVRNKLYFYNDSPHYQIHTRVANQLWEDFEQ